VDAENLRGKSMADKPLLHTQAAALARLKKDGTVHWSATSATDSRAMNALVEKGIAVKVTIDEIVTVYQLAK
jgi:hypothetical protein